MTDVLYDIQLAQAVFKMNTDFTSDDKKDQVIEGILKKHKISQADLDSSLIWYSDNINIYIDINDEVAERLKTDYDTVEARRNHLNKNVRDWSKYIIPPFFYLTESSPLISFEIDSVKRKTLDMKSFNIAFNVQGINKLQDVEAAIYYTYKDTLIRNTFSIDENARTVLKKPELPDSLLKEVSGYIYMRNKIEGATSNVLFYNVSYSDSIFYDDDIMALSAIKEPVRRERIRPNQGSIESVRKDINSTETKSLDTPKSEDDIPVLSRDDVNKSPILKRSRDSERIKRN